MPPKKRPSEVLLPSRGRPRSITTTHDTGNNDDEPHSEQRSAERRNAIPMRGRPPKRIKSDPDGPVTPKASPPAAFHQSFIMKLFDRSLDLAKYAPNSALYPICRAWMVNQPRSNKLINFKQRVVLPPVKRPAHTNILEALRAGKVTEIQAMPALKRPSADDMARIPEPLPVDAPAGSLDLNYDLDTPSVSRAELLAALKQRSAAVRKNWQAHTKKYQEQTYERSFSLLECIYKQ